MLYESTSSSHRYLSRLGNVCPIHSLSAGTHERKMQNHRVIEWYGLEGTLKIIWFKPPCHGQGHLPLDEVAQSPIQPGLEHSQ